MRTRRPAAEQLPADELFRSRLENQIDLRHPLVQLSHRLPWSALEQLRLNFQVQHPLSS
ncbi:hypothetical protein [Xanthomonas oryzae]|nr:hypothetical protein [Xanthomonas oryzae]QUW77681.1 hypothetical protein KCI36_15075 [Xanthomonas oryzae]WDN43094.1 hypothetical protein LL925_13420 [Xanthomonas oryzae]